MTTTASIILLAVGAYAALGVVVGAVFVVRGVSRVDPAAAGAPIGFKLLILPGVVGMWPMMLRWWFRAGRTHQTPGTHTAPSVRGPGTANTAPPEGSPR